MIVWQTPCPSVPSIAIDNAYVFSSHGTKQVVPTLDNREPNNFSMAWNIMRTTKHV
jgi:hypothetical protein